MSFLIGHLILVIDGSINYMRLEKVPLSLHNSMNRRKSDRRNINSERRKRYAGYAGDDATNFERDRRQRVRNPRTNKRRAKTTAEQRQEYDNLSQEQRGDREFTQRTDRTRREKQEFQSMFNNQEKKREPLRRNQQKRKERRRASSDRRKFDQQNNDAYKDIEDDDTSSAKRKYSFTYGKTGQNSYFNDSADNQKSVYRVNKPQEHRANDSEDEKEILQRVFLITFKKLQDYIQLMVRTLC